MNIFEGPYYRINMFLLTCVGQWPYQNPLHKRLIRLAVLFFAVSIVVPEMLYLATVWGGDPAEVSQCGSFFGAQMVSGMKFLNFILNDAKMKTLTDSIYNDWEVIGMGPQCEIIKTHADRGRKLSEFYSVYMLSATALYVIMPLMPKFLDLMMPLNESRAMSSTLPAKYGDIDPNKYFFPMMVHADIAVCLTITNVVAMDAIYAVFIEHACGLFAALGDKLERLMEIDVDESVDHLDKDRQEEIIYQDVVSCVKMHTEAIKYAALIETSHVAVSFVVIGLTIFCSTISGYQMVMNFDDPNDAFRSGVVVFGAGFQIFFLCWRGQKLMDYSGRIHECVYGARWYDISTRSKKLLLLLMLRSKVPCKLTAGKLYDMSLANFSMVMRTSVSYFTVLTSVT